MSLPSWLQRSSKTPHLTHVIHELQYREQSREIIRMSQDDSQICSQDPQPSRQIPPEIAAYYQTSVGLQTSHQDKNRYTAFEPYDRTRVLVPNVAKPGACDEVSEDGETRLGYRYINANWVRELYGGKWWIAAQAPLPHTAHAFLTLTMTPAPPPALPRESSTHPPLRSRVHTIVQLTLPMERGRRRADPYFPGCLHEPMILHCEEGGKAPNIRIHAESEKIIEEAQCVMTDLRLSWDIPSDQATATSVNRKGEMQVTHLLYTTWPDFGIPQDNRSILNFARLVERVNNRNSSDPSDDNPNASPPIMIHCSAGVGRTGSFIAFMSLLRTYSLLTPFYVSSKSGVSLLRRMVPSRLTKAPKLPPPLPVSLLGPLPSRMENDLIAQEVDSLREQRQSMVQKRRQIIWIYHALSYAFQVT